MPAPLFANPTESLGPVTNGFVPAVLEQEVRRIYARSPLYGRRFPLHPEPLEWSCYREIPALSKREIVEKGHQAFFADYAAIERGLQAKRYEYESTGGTTQAPMTVIMEEGWWNAQTARAYRASPLLREFADRPYRKCVLAPVGCSSNLCPYEDHPFPHRYFDGTVYLNLSSDPFAFPEGEWDRIVLELQATKPEVIEGEPVYLSLLARATQRRGVRVPSVKAVILTYGKASTQHGRQIEGVPRGAG
jgi:phenylacetate-CoA ligase